MNYNKIYLLSHLSRNITAENFFSAGEDNNDHLKTYNFYNKSHNSPIQKCG